ncbi:MAG: tetratricopeptide repeat protein [Deltaproteobacteria bacterium]|nr:tetratricopeptide repeat protein [Deltaproteobacteria bacterium]
MLTQNLSHRRQLAGMQALSLGGANKVPEQAFVADARSDLPLRFTDGSTVVFRAGSAGRMQRFTGAGAEIVLERGWLDAHVVHADTTLWLVHAGPYRVRVTGTRFAMTWSGASFQVDLYEGAVVVDGSVLGAGVPLRAGQRLKISSGVVLVEPLAGDGTPTTVPAGDPAVDPGVAPGPLALAPPPEVDQAPAALPVGSSRASKTGMRSSAARTDAARSNGANDWLALAERGRYREALAAAQRVGWGTLCRRLDARHLLTLGDIARYAGAQPQARQAFQALVTRYPDNRLTADAVFSLGRLAYESSHPNEATRWFRRYVTDWPEAPLADQAAGRLLECAIRIDDREAARSAARRYLARAPGGPHATLAQEVLGQPVAGRP